MHKKKLIISPHIDDEVLGCVSVLDKDAYVIYCGCDESAINFEWVKDRPAKEDRILELKELQNKLLFSYQILENKVNHYKIKDLIPEFEKIINLIKPEEIYIPLPSYNQDHRIVYEAALIALRPHDINFFVKKVLVYEQVQDLWNHNGHEFKPLFFKKLNILKKIESYQILKSQVRDFRSSEMIKNLASIRGIQSNTQYAEAFEVLRWIED